MTTWTKLRKILDDDRNWAIVAMAAAIGASVAAWVRGPEPVWNPVWWPSWVAAALAVVSSVGLFLRKEWSRYTCLLLVGLLAFFVARGFYRHGFTIYYGVLTVLTVCMAYQFWKMPITRVQQLLANPNWVQSVLEKSAELQRELESQPTQRMIVLLREPIPLDASRLAELAQRAYGQPFDIIPGEQSHVNAAFLPKEHPEPFVAGEPPTLLCFRSPFYQGVSWLDAIHPSACALRGSEDGELPGRGNGEPPDGEALDDDSWVPAFGHRAAVEIELLPTMEHLTPHDPGYAHMAKLVAQLMDNRCVGLCFPNGDKQVPLSAQVVAALHSDNPAAALQLDEAAPAS